MRHRLGGLLEEVDGAVPIHDQGLPAVVELLNQLRIGYRAAQDIGELVDRLRSSAAPGILPLVNDRLGLHEPGEHGDEGLDREHGATDAGQRSTDLHRKLSGLTASASET